MWAGKWMLQKAVGTPKLLFYQNLPTSVPFSPFLRNLLNLLLQIRRPVSPLETPLLPQPALLLSAIITFLNYTLLSPASSPHNVSYKPRRAASV